MTPNKLSSTVNFFGTHGLNCLLLAILAVMAPLREPSAHLPCPAVVPEAIDDVKEHGLPRNSTRWAAIERIWTEVSPTLRELVRDSLAKGGLVPTADFIQGRTQDLLRESIVSDRRELSEQLLQLWSEPFGFLKYSDRVSVYYLTPQQRRTEVQLPRPHPMWIGANSEESVLYSAIYLAGATDIAAAIAAMPAQSRSPPMLDFVRSTASIAVDHYRRWSAGPPGIWQVRGWGCAAGGLNLREFTKQRLDRSLGNNAFPYCQSPTDTDMLIAIGVTNILAASARAPDLVSLADADRSLFQDIVLLYGKFMASRLATTSVSDHGQSLIDFDPGAWTLHGDLAYAGNESPEFPKSKPAPKAGVGWDFSHGARIAWMILTFADHPQFLGSDVNWSGVAAGFARQVAFRVLDNLEDAPRFRNFLDGSNGWYRVNYLDRPDTGVPPYGLSRSYFTMPWARLSIWHADLLGAAHGAWRMLTSYSTQHCNVLKDVYLEGSYWRKGSHGFAPLTGVQGGIDLLTFLAVSPVSDRP